VQITILDETSGMLKYAPEKTFESTETHRYILGWGPSLSEVTIDTHLGEAILAKEELLVHLSEKDGSNTKRSGSVGKSGDFRGGFKEKEMKRFFVSGKVVGDDAREGGLPRAEAHR